MLSEKDLAFLAAACQVQPAQAQNVLALLDQGCTVPFISRYRKEMTGALDDARVQGLSENYDSLKELNERKATILKTIGEQEKLTPELAARIEATYSKTELEDLYLPFKPKKRTKATIAREKGLAPLAESILTQAGEASARATLEELAKPFVDTAKGVASADEALAGAGHILAEQFAEHAGFRRQVRQHVFEHGIWRVTVTKEWVSKRSKFEHYYDYQEPLKSIPSHRILAIRRGEDEKVLSARVEIDRDALRVLYRALLFAEGHPYFDFLDQVTADALERLLLTSVELDIMTELKKEADEAAIRVFAANLESLLMAPPAGPRRVLGVDPGFRTGAKLVALDETGKLLDTATIYPTQSQARIQEAQQVVEQLFARHRLTAVVIGNGTASRETQEFFRTFLPKEVILSVVSEAGASVYSASETGREEFPDHDVTVRGSVSIGRRFQDPLAELVKIDAKAIGVGQYQHDVNQGLLKKKLDHVVEAVVNRVGVDLNTASKHLLQYVSGIGETLAKNIVTYRNEHGAFRSREELGQVRLFGPKAFLQSAGFLRIAGGSNPLDGTGIHPESYGVVSAMCARLGKGLPELIRNRSLLQQIRPEEWVSGAFGLPTIQDILRELEAPGRDPRRDFAPFEFAAGIEKISDLAEEMVLPGVVTNVTRFGAFVDIGVHQDGLVHVSELSHRFIRDPEQEIHAGDQVKVKVLKVDVELKRIQLSIKAVTAPPAPPVRSRPERRPPQAPPSPRPPDRQSKPAPRPERAPQPPAPPRDPLGDLKKKWGAR